MEKNYFHQFPQGCDTAHMITEKALRLGLHYAKRSKRDIYPHEKTEGLETGT